MAAPVEERKCEVGSVTTCFGAPSTAGCMDGKAGYAKFKNPAGLHLDKTNNLLILTDCSNHVIRGIDLSTRAVGSIAGSVGAGSADGKASDAKFNHPYHVVGDDDGYFVADHSNHCIRKIWKGEDGSVQVKTIAGKAGAAGNVDGVEDAARFNGPHGLALVGNLLFVADYYNARVRQVDLDTNTVTTLSADGALGNVIGICSVTSPSGVTSLYVANAYRIHRISLDGAATVTPIAGGAQGDVVDKCGENARFHNLRQICASEDGRWLFACDYSVHKIKRIALEDGGMYRTTTIAGTGAAGVVDGPVGVGQFINPYGIACDSDRKCLWVADHSGHCIRRIYYPTPARVEVEPSSFVDRAVAAINDPDNHDTVIECKDGERVLCHRTDLCRHIPHFKRVFSAPMREGREGVIPLTDFEASTVFEVVLYAMTDDLRVRPENVVQLLHIGNYMECKRIKQLAAKYATENLCEANVVAILIAAHTMGRCAETKQLEASCLAYLREHQEEVERADPDALARIAAAAPELLVALFRASRV